MIDSFMSEYGILVLLAFYGIVATWPIWVAVAFAILVTSAIKGEAK